jgi:parallel beta-helix repeat protein
MIGRGVRFVPWVTTLGMILLGQSLLVGGPVATAHAQGPSVACGDTIAASIALDADLIDCPQDGLIIGADNVTIDLNGHTIDGPGTTDTSWDGIDNGAGHDGVTILNGTLQDFGGDGVYLDGGARGNRLANLVLTDNGIGVEVFRSANNAVKALTIVGNHVEGIVVNSSLQTVISRSTLANVDAENEVLLFGATDTLIEGNHIGGGVSAGIQSLVGRHDEIKKNVFTGDGTSAVGAFMDSAESLIAKNDITGFDQAAIFVGADRVRVEKNSLHDSGLGVILLGNPVFCCPTGVVVRRNHAFNTDVGIAVRDMTDALVRHNVTHDNRIGISVRDSTGTVILKNRSNRNTEDGILILDPATTVAHNRADLNGDLGIDAVEGVIDGGGNKARGNGNPAQCLNVDCSAGGG